MFARWMIDGDGGPNVTAAAVIEEKRAPPKIIACVFARILGPTGHRKKVGKSGY